MAIRQIYISVILCILFVLGASFAFASAGSKDEIDIIPVVNYEYVSMANRHYYVPGVMGVVMQGNRELPFEQDSNSFFLGASYRQHRFSDARVEGYSDTYHSIQMMVEKRIDRHYCVVLLESYAERPIVEGLQSFAAGPGYAYEFMQSDSFSFIFGLGIGVTDLGIDMPNGRPLPVIPMPVARVAGNWEWCKFMFEFIIRPMLNITIAPEKKIRMNAFIYMEQYSGFEDILFDCNLWYRFFSDEHPLGDFAGIAMGIKNEGKRFSLSDEDKWYSFHHYSVFAKLDLSVLQLACGYIFIGNETYENDRKKIKKNTGTGMWVSVQGAYKF